MGIDTLPYSAESAGYFNKGCGCFQGYPPEWRLDADFDGNVCDCDSSVANGKTLCYSAGQTEEEGNFSDLEIGYDLLGDIVYLFKSHRPIE